MTSGITGDTVFDEPEPILSDHQQPAQSSKKDPVIDEGEVDYDKRMLDAIMGFEGGEEWYWNTNEDKVWNTNPNDDPLATLSRATVAKAMIEKC